MTYKLEILLAATTIITTMITGDFWIDLLSGLVIYSLSRLFYRLIGYKLNNGVDWLKSWLKKVYRWRK